MFPFAKAFTYEGYVVHRWCPDFIKAFDQEFYKDVNVIRSVISSNPPNPTSHQTKFSPPLRNYWKGKRKRLRTTAMLL